MRCSCNFVACNIRSHCSQFHTGFWGKLCWKKSYSSYLARAFCQLGISFSFLFIFSCSGNKARFATEIRTWFPEYKSISVCEKIELGALTILMYYFSFFESNYTLLPLYIVIAIVFYAKNKKLFVLQICLAVFTLLCFLSQLSNRFLFSNRMLARFSTYSNIAVAFECICLFLAFAVLLFQIYAASLSKSSGILNVVLVIIGFCSAFILVFSPTVYASGARCYLFMDTILFVVCFRIFSEQKQLHFLG